MKKNSILACLSVAAFCLPATGHALPTVYEYTGQHYQTASGDYTLDMRISGTMTLEDPLVAGTSQFITSPQSFSFFDGLVTVTNGNSAPLAADKAPWLDISTIWVSTGSNGEIIEWYLLFKLADEAAAGTQIFSSIRTNQSFEATARLGPDATASRAFIGGLQNAGTWSVSAVPEPSAYALMLTGLGLVGYVVSRRKRAY